MEMAKKHWNLFCRNTFLLVFPNRFSCFFIGRGSHRIIIIRWGFTSAGVYTACLMVVTPTEFPRVDTKSHRDGISVSRRRQPLQKATSVPAQSDT